MLYVETGTNSQFYSAKLLLFFGLNCSHQNQPVVVRSLRFTLKLTFDNQTPLTIQNLGSKHQAISSKGRESLNFFGQAGNLP
jgi:hypothetical protein